MKTIKNNIYLHVFLFVFISCKGQKHDLATLKKEIVCGNYLAKFELPKIEKEKEYKFDEGKSITYITKDNVIIEFYCGGNYTSHIGNSKYKVIYESNNLKFGINTDTNLFWGKNKKLVYSNCKVQDTAFYNNLLKKFKLQRKNVNRSQ